MMRETRWHEEKMPYRLMIRRGAGACARTGKAAEIELDAKPGINEYPAHFAVGFCERTSG